MVYRGCWMIRGRRVGEGSVTGSADGVVIVVVVGGDADEDTLPSMISR